MTESPRSGSPFDPTEQVPYRYQASSDPAYAGNYPYSSPYGSAYQDRRPYPDGSAYSAAGAPQGPAPTEQLGPYWTQGYGQLPPGGPPPEPPQKSRPPGWLWLLAGLAVTLVIGLVTILVIASNQSRKDTAVAPMPSMPQTAPTTTRTSPPTTRQLPPAVPTRPLPTTGPSVPSTGPTQTTAPGPTESVVYEVTGEGRAINITYVDGNLMQTEFNVVLPWRMEVSVPSSSAKSASVTVINVGRDVTCTISIGGVQVDTRTGAGLTICAAR